MNQILSIDNYQKKEKNKKKKIKNNGPVEINSILKFFSISILLFGIFLIGTGSYSMYKGSSSEESKTKPVIYVETVSETEILIRIQHDKNLKEVNYQWNDEEPIQVPCDGKKQVEDKVKIPTGNNKLKVYAKDINGEEIEYQRLYDITGKITINIEPQGNNLKITAEGKNKLTYMTYRWDEEEEEKVEINENEKEVTIEIPKGLHTLTVIAVDENNNTETKEQEVKGVTRPKLNVTIDEANNLVIKASDEQGLTKVEFIINETEKYMLDLTKVYEIDERKEFEYSYQLHDGENKIEVTVYNENDVSETFTYNS